MAPETGADIASTAPIAFIGGGNMATALIGGLIRAGHAPAAVFVVEPFEAQRERLRHEFGVVAQAEANAQLVRADVVVWAVKPQLFALAAAPCAAYVKGALQLSVMAGIRTEAIARASGSERVVRAMPNTPALIGQGIAGLYARPAVTAAERASVESLLAPTGTSLWLAQESDLDAVTALSGSGPAYVFYVLEALMQAGAHMGLAPGPARELALATLAGATELARRSSDTPQTLRAQVTSKGGTTHAAISALEAAGVKSSFIQAVLAAQQRAKELGDEFGAA